MKHGKDSTELRHLVAQKRREGRLPRMSTARTWAGESTGAVCVLCEIPIHAGQIEYEVEWRKGTDTEVLRFHELCYRLCSEA